MTDLGGTRSYRGWMGITFTRRETRTIGIGALIVAIGAGMTSNMLFLAAFHFGWTGS